MYFFSSIFIKWFWNNFRFLVFSFCWTKKTKKDLYEELNTKMSSWSITAIEKIILIFFAKNDIPTIILAKISIFDCLSWLPGRSQKDMRYVIEIVSQRSISRCNWFSCISFRLATKVSWKSRFSRFWDFHRPKFNFWRKKFYLKKLWKIQWTLYIVRRCP